MAEEDIIRGCQRHEPTSQRELYQSYFNFAMNLCVRYSRDKDEAKAILLDAFRCILNDFSRYSETNEKRGKNSQETITLEQWIKQEVIAAAIRQLHANKKEHFVSSTVSTRDAGKPLTERSDEQIIKAAGLPLIIKALQQLKPSLRTIYNLHEVDGYGHAEISKLMDISEYISKDSLSKAKFNIRKYLVTAIPA